MYTLGQSPAPPGTTPEAQTRYPILETLQSLIPAVGSAIGQVKLIDLNAELIRQGKAPLSVDQARALSPQINVGITPDTRTMLLYGLGGIGLLMLLTTFMRSR